MTKHTPLPKLSPAQRKVLEVMAEGATLARTRWGSEHWNVWRGAATGTKPPTGVTVHKLEGLGFITGPRTGHFTREFHITPKGREALK